MNDIIDIRYRLFYPKLKILEKDLHKRFSCVKLIISFIPLDDLCIYMCVKILFGVYKMIFLDDVSSFLFSLHLIVISFRNYC